MTHPQPDPLVLPAVLGWANPDTGPENLRLYALDAGPSPRWAKPHARVVEQAIVEYDGGQLREGDRYLVVRLGSRFVDDDRVASILSRVAALLTEEPE